MTAPTFTERQWGLIRECVWCEHQLLITDIIPNDFDEEDKKEHRKRKAALERILSKLDQ